MKSTKNNIIKVPEWNLPLDSQSKENFISMIKQNLGFGKEISFDLGFYDYDKDEKLIKRKQTLKESESKFAVELLDLLNGFPNVPRELSDSEFCLLIDSAIKTMFGKDGNGDLLSNAFQSSRYLNHFMDKLLETWINPSLTKVVLILKLMLNPNFIKNVKRNHLVTLCHYVLYRKDTIVSSCLYNLMVEVPQLSCSVLETLVIDEVKKQSNDSIAFACRAIKILHEFSKNGVIDNPENLLEIFERVMQNNKNAKLNTAIIEILCETGNVSKKLFNLVQTVYTFKIHTDTLKYRFFDFCKATKTLHLVSHTDLFESSSTKEEREEVKRVMKDQKEKVIKLVKTGYSIMKVEIPKFGENQFDPKFSSMEELKKHFDTCKFTQDPTLNQKMLETNREIADFNYVHTLFSRFTYYTSKISKIAKPTRNKDVRMIADDILSILLNNGYALDFLKTDYQHLIDYMFEEEYNLRLTDLLYFFGMCCKYNFMIIEYLGNRKYSIKPLYTYLIDIGMIERLEKLIRENIKLSKNENEISKRLKVDYVNEALGFISGIFIGMTTHKDLGRLKYILNETKLFETLIYCWDEYKWSSDMRDHVFICLQKAIDISEKLSLSLVFEKYILAAFNQSIDYATLKNKEYNLATLTINLVSKLSGMGVAVLKQSGKLPKLNRIILDAVSGSGFFDKAMGYLIKNVTKFNSKDKVDTNIEDEATDENWTHGMGVLLSFAVRHSPIRELFYKDDYKYLRVLLKNVMYPLYVHLSKVTFKDIQNSTLCYTYANFYSVINHILWDKKGQDFIFQSVSNRTIMERLTLENMNLKWLNRALQHLEGNTSYKLSMEQEIVLARSVYCMSCMAECKVFESKIEGLNLVDPIMRLLDYITGVKTVLEINKSVIKILFVLIHVESIKDQLDLRRILKFISYEMDYLLSDVAMGLFYSLIGSCLKEETEAIVPTEFPKLKPYLERAKGAVPKCNYCGKLYTVHHSLKKCGACGLVHYCGLNCQKKDRENHKEECQKQSNK